MHNSPDLLIQVEAHLDAQPFIVLAHNMDSLYSIQLTAFNGAGEELWQATIDTEQARYIMDRASRLTDAEGEPMEPWEFNDLLNRLDKEWEAMCNPIAPPAPKHPVCTRQQAVDLLAAHTGKHPVELVINGVAWSVE
jgi:hypothetical protein